MIAESLQSSEHLSLTVKGEQCSLTAQKSAGPARSRGTECADYTRVFRSLDQNHFMEIQVLDTWE